MDVKTCDYASRPLCQPSIGLEGRERPSRDSYPLTQVVHPSLSGENLDVGRKTHVTCHIFFPRHQLHKLCVCVCVCVCVFFFECSYFESLPPCIKDAPEMCWMLINDKRILKNSGCS